LNANILGSDPYLYPSYKALQYKIERSTSINYNEKPRDMDTIVHMTRRI